VTDKRTARQNSLMWARLNQISNQVSWHDKSYDPEQWKQIFTAMMDGQESVPALEGEGVIFIAKSGTRNRTKQWHIDLETYIEAFCARQGVVFPADEIYDSYPEVNK